MSDETTTEVEEPGDEETGWFEPAITPSPHPRQMPAVEMIVEAITNYGDTPIYHQAQMSSLRYAWPSLARAIANLLLERGLDVPEELR